MTLTPSRARAHHTGPLGLTFLGVSWLSIACAIAYLAVVVPLDRLVVARDAGVTRWLAIAAVAVLPASLATLGAIRLGTGVKIAFARRSSTVRRMARQLAPDMKILPAALVDGRMMPDMVVGRHGVAIFRELPADAAVRRYGGHWEIEIENVWVPFENPLERTSRDADHLRRALAADDWDFVVRVHAAIVTTAGDLERLPGCAVVRPDQIRGFLAALPPQRTLTPERIETIIGFLLQRG